MLSKQKKGKKSRNHRKFSATKQILEQFEEMPEIKGKPDLKESMKKFRLCEQV